MKEIVEALQNRHPLQDLNPKAVWDAELDRKIEALSADMLGASGSEQEAYALAFISGLHLWNDSLDKCHDILQDPILYDHHATGNYWHAIMHRLESDYNNSRDWFGDLVHPVFEELHEQVTALLKSEVPFDSLKQTEVTMALEKMRRQTAWDPYLFINAVESQSAEGKDPFTQLVLQKIQWLEMALLLRFTYNKSCGKMILDDIHR